MGSNIYVWPREERDVGLEVAVDIDCKTGWVSPTLSIFDRKFILIEDVLEIEMSVSQLH